MAASSSSAARAPDERRLASQASKDSLFYRSTRDEMVKNGIPDEYADALLDEGYMDRLINATNKMQRKRRKAMDRYVLLNKGVLFALFLWSLLGILIGLYKAELQPPMVWYMDVNLQDVDLVLMIDASNHMYFTHDDQSKVIMGITETLFDAIANLRNDTAEKARYLLEEAKARYTLENPTLLERLGVPRPGMGAGSSEGAVITQGGYMRIATALFNSDMGRDLGLLHEFNFAKDGKKLLVGMDKDKYKSYSQWHEAFTACRDMLQNVEPVRYPGQVLQKEGRCQPWPKKEDAKECHTFRHASDCPGAYCQWNEETDEGVPKGYKPGCQPKEPFCRRQFCVIVGDGEAMCKRQGQANSPSEVPEWKKKSEALCNRFPDMCPPAELREKYASTLEYPEEMEACSQFSRSLMITDDNITAEDRLDVDKLNSRSDMNLVMVLNTATPSQKQMFLRDPSFSKFVYSALDCSIFPKPMRVNLSNGQETIVEMLAPDDSTDSSCVRFIIESGAEQLRKQAKRLAGLLKADLELSTTPNAQIDKSYRVFYLLALTLPFFFGWTRIVKWYTAFKLQAQRRMGAKKRMIKVTKSIVEKDPELLVQKLPHFEELEMVDIKRLQRPVEVGMPLLLRSRLKGGYLRANVNTGVADGHGHAFEQVANWTFESKAEGAIQVGQAIKVRNMNSQVLVVDADGAHFMGDEEGDAASPNFTVENVEEEDRGIFLGDCIRLKCVSTGQYLRVSKDGAVDGLGDKAQPETQVVVDEGGTPIVSGSIVTLHLQSAKGFAHSTPTGEVHVGTRGCGKECGDDWRFWYIEKQMPMGEEPSMLPKSSASRGRSAENPHEKHSRRQSRAAVDMLHEVGLSSRSLLHEGDVVTLQGFNQEFLEIDEANGVLGCGLRKLGEGRGGGLRVGGEQSQPQDFLIHRIGVSRVTKHNQTIRRGAQICLQPVHNGEMAGKTDYVRCKDGRLAAQGLLTDRDIVITIDVGPIASCVEPLTLVMSDGDAEVVIEGSKGRPFEALSAAWTDDASLETIKGQCVAREQDGSYSEGARLAGQWVALVQGGLNLYDSCKQAKKQGATGVIVICEDTCSYERLKFGATEDQAKPALPAVFVTELVGDELRKGLRVKCCRIKKQHVTNLMRVLGRIGSSNQPAAEVFKAAGLAMMARWQAGEHMTHISIATGNSSNAPSARTSFAPSARTSFQSTTAQAQLEADHRLAMQEADNLRRMAAARARAEADPMGENANIGKKGYTWAISANSNYFWAGSVVHVQKAPVGARRPPQQQFRAVLDDAEQFHTPDEGTRAVASSTRERKSSSGKATRTSEKRVSVVHTEAHAVRRMHLGSDLGKVLTEEEALQAAEQAEELSSDSDFKILYKFEEVEVGIDERPEDLDEEAYLVDEGMVIQAIGVPKSKFWVVAFGLLAFTLLLLTFAYVVFLSMKDKPRPPPPYPIGYREAMGLPPFDEGGVSLHQRFLGFMPGDDAHSSAAAALHVKHAFARSLAEVGLRGGRP